MNSKHTQHGILALRAPAIIGMVPGGFTITAEAWRYFVRTNQLDPVIAERLGEIEAGDPESLGRVGLQIRSVLRDADFPKELDRAIGEAYYRLSGDRGPDATAVYLGSAAIAEDEEPEVSGVNALLDAIRNRFAAQFSDQAISDRRQLGLEHDPEDLLVSRTKREPPRPTGPAKDEA